MCSHSKRFHSCDGMVKEKFNLRTRNGRTDSELYSTKIPKSPLGYHRLLGPPFSLAMVERPRLEQKREVGGVQLTNRAIRNPGSVELTSPQIARSR
jgi:hypothetical protein